ncbi:MULTISPECIES: tyrosinase family oxidase copper chaperone [unclassified Streptomyces]|uniref:tyrosinase family oxidase copper chaperone n=1 Tax=unclassified Streptomyces TaxID=2593676 RepID=UPI003D755FAF
MVVDVSGLPVGAERPRADAVRPVRGRGVRRRDLVRGLLGAAAATAAIVPVAAASRPPHDPGGGAGDTGFDEFYRGRRLVGVPPATDRVAAGPADDDGRWRVTVDGRPLHLMRRADGTWLSMVDHYRSYATPLAAARAAVDELGPGEHLLDTRTGHPHLGGHHGLHP